MIRSLGQIRQEYPLLGTPLRKDRWVWAHAVLRGKSSYLGLSNAEDTVFIAATTPLLLNFNHQRELLLLSCVSPYLRHSTKRTKLRMLPVDSLMKVAYSKESSVSN